MKWVQFISGYFYAGKLVHRELRCKIYYMLCMGKVLTYLQRLRKLNCINGRCELKRTGQTALAPGRSAFIWLNEGSSFHNYEHIYKNQ